MDKLKKDIGNWVKRNNNNVVFVGSFIEFKNNKASDNVIIGFGDKKIINILTKEHLKMLKASKEKFINW